MVINVWFGSLLVLSLRVPNQPKSTYILYHSPETETLRDFVMVDLQQWKMGVHYVEIAIKVENYLGQKINKKKENIYRD